MAYERGGRRDDYRHSCGPEWDDWLTRAEAAALLCVSAGYLRELVQHRRVHVAVTPHGLLYYRLDVLRVRKAREKAGRLPGDERMEAMG